jgi:hypothetical protein
MQEARDRLPAAKAKGEFLRVLGEHRVVLVAGETGCVDLIVWVEEGWDGKELGVYICLYTCV